MHRSKPQKCKQIPFKKAAVLLKLQQQFPEIIICRMLPAFAKLWDSANRIDDFIDLKNTTKLKILSIRKNLCWKSRKWATFRQDVD